MSQDRSHTSIQERIQKPDKIPEKQQGKKKANYKRQDLFRLQEMVFSLSPLFLKNYIDLLETEDNKSEQLPEIDDIGTEDGVDLESDLDVEDEEELPCKEDEQSRISPEYGIRLGDASFFQDSPVFQPNTVYTITVAPASNGKYLCRFEGPAWFGRRLPGDIRLYVNKLQNFLSAVAKWLEDSKQLFLKEPIPVNFVKGEAASPFDPVVQQKGFVNKINSFIPDHPRVDETAFSRLLDNIWLVWPEWNMPLKHIFTKEFEEAWLMEVCTEFYIIAGTMPGKTLQYPDFGAEDLSRIKDKVIDRNTKSIMEDKFKGLSPEEKLHFLRNRIECNIDRAQQILRQISKKMKDKGYCAP